MSLLSWFSSTARELRKRKKHERCERLSQAIRVLEQSDDEPLRMNSYDNCILGLCGRDPWFIERGFYHSSAMGSVRYQGPSGPFWGYGAAEKFFHLSPQTVLKLFGTYRSNVFKSNTVSPNGAIAALRQYL